MTELYTNVYNNVNGKQVLTPLSPGASQPVRPQHPKTYVWMSRAAVRATVAIAAASMITCTVARASGQSYPVVDRAAVPAVLSADDTQAPWLDQVSANLRELRHLKAGWDSYGAPRITGRAIRRMVSLLEDVATASTPAPSIAPTSEGGVQVEWHEGGMDLELRSDSDGHIYAFMRQPSVGEEWDDLLPSADLAAAWLDRIATVPA